MLMLRRRTGPKTGTHTVRELAQWICIWTFYKSHWVGEFPEKCGGLRARLDVEMHFTFNIAHEPFRMPIYTEKTCRPVGSP